LIGFYGVLVWVHLGENNIEKREIEEKYILKIGWKEV